MKAAGAAGLARVVVTGGGSAGHVVPALPVIEALRERGAEVHFVGGVDGIERRLAAPRATAYHGIQTGKLRRYLSARNLIDCLRVPVGVYQAWRLLGRLRPQVVFSKGGFVSFPVVLGAWLRGIPAVAHESDLTPGLANRLAAPLVASLCVNFPLKRGGRGGKGRRVVATGTPLRAELEDGDPERGRVRLGVDGAKPLLLVVGGSLGAERLNDMVRAALDALLARYAVAHVCGAGKIDPERAGIPGYAQLEYVDAGWGDIIAAADLVVSRAGAGALYEWLALGKPNLLVPLPKRASRGDQIDNAKFAAEQGWSLVIAEETLDAGKLVAGLARLQAEASLFRKRLAAFQPRDSVGLVIGELERAAGVSGGDAGTGGACGGHGGAPLERAGAGGGWSSK